ncbi:MAG: hypothetical protein AB7F35_15545 [Acetobacteraceae bacterium]
MRNLLSLALLSAALSACASQPVIYTKAGATPAEAQIATAKCKMALQQTQLLMPIEPSATDLGGSVSQLGATLNSRSLQADYFNNCMIANGWFPQTQASQGAQSPLVEELKIALQHCNAEDADNRDKVVAWSECYDRVQRPVWAKYSPDNMDLYDAYSAKVKQLAVQFHNGEISQEKNADGIKDAGAVWISSIEARRDRAAP